MNLPTDLDAAYQAVRTAILLRSKRQRGGQRPIASDNDVILDAMRKVRAVERDLGKPRRGDPVRIRGSKKRVGTTHEAALTILVYCRPVRNPERMIRACEREAMLASVWRQAELRQQYPLEANWQTITISAAPERLRELLGGKDEEQTQSDTTVRQRAPNQAIGEDAPCSLASRHRGPNQTPSNEPDGPFMRGSRNRCFRLGETLYDRLTPQQYRLLELLWEKRDRRGCCCLSYEEVGDVICKHRKGTKPEQRVCSITVAIYRLQVRLESEADGPRVWPADQRVYAAFSGTVSENN